MKRIFLILAAILILLTGCNNSTELSDTPTESTPAIVITETVTTPTTENEDPKGTTDNADAASSFSASKETEMTEPEETISGTKPTVTTEQPAQTEKKETASTTKLPVKGNKKKAEEMLYETRKTFIPPEEPVEGVLSSEMLFTDFMKMWLAVAKSTIKITTYSSYAAMVNNIIIPYFDPKKLKLTEISAKDIQQFYLVQLERVKPNSVIHYHAVIHRAMKYAVRTDLIASNPVDKVDRPKKNAYQGSFYSEDEMQDLFEVARGTKLELPIVLASFYGLRRSEVLGLKWSAIDFQQNTITIQHTLTSCQIDGKLVEVASDTTKTKSSRRTLPLIPQFRDMLLQRWELQEEYKRVCGRCYNRKYLDYICVDEMGNIIKPDYLTDSFSKLLARHGLRHIRFHDLRHTCASLLLKNGVPMKQIQEWLGHSDFSTTANIYAHLDYNSKLNSAQAMMTGMSAALITVG